MKKKRIEKKELRKERRGEIPYDTACLGSRIMIEDALRKPQGGTNELEAAYTKWYL